MPEKPRHDDRGDTMSATSRDDDGSYRPRTRLFVTQDLASSATVDLESPQAHYLLNVLRLKTGATIALFNGRDGEWGARIESVGRGRCTVALLEQARPQRAEPDLWLLFAPLKKARTDYLAEKATEIGASLLWPVFTRRTQAERVNLDRLRANATEAAEQSERLSVPELRAPVKLADVLAAWPADRRLLFCDETGGGPPIAAALQTQGTGSQGLGKWAVLIGPEGGFARDELDALRKLPFVTAAGLGPRILRADTAALAALVVVQALVGDWKSAPRD
jgi:16S rRNA (uracil1498-N3)-methyltransferase